MSEFVRIALARARAICDEFAEVDSGTADLTNVTLSGNTGSLSGAMFNTNGTVTLTNVTLYSNREQAGGYGGGGISNYDSTANLTLNNVTFSANTAGGGGAGLENAFGANATLTNVTFSGNVTGNMGGAGGGLHTYKATATLTDVTFSGNSAPTSSTSGGGIWNENDPANHLFLRNVIIANSPAGGNASFQKAPDSNVSNLSSDNTCNFGVGHDNVNVKLGPLASNGGFTQTHALFPGSPAINAANIALAPSRDQRVHLRVGAPDIGAFEFDGFATPRPILTVMSSPISCYSTPARCALRSGISGGGRLSAGHSAQACPLAGQLSESPISIKTVRPTTCSFGPVRGRRQSGI